MARILLMLLLAALAHAQASLIGRWRAMKTSQGGIGAIFEFRDDGAFSFSPGAVVEAKYRIDGNQLVLPPDTIDGPELHQTMEWVSADRLVLRESQTLTRQGTVRDPSNPILGEWTAPGEAFGFKAEVHYFFQPRGKVLFLCPFKWQKGGYSVKGGTVRMQYSEGPPVEGPFRVEGDMLTIPSAGKPGELQLKRY